MNIIVSDAAVQAASLAVNIGHRDFEIPQRVLKLALTAALPHLALSSAPCSADMKLPCDVQLPGALIKRGVSLSTLMSAIERRKDWPEEDTRLTTKPVDVAAVRGNEFANLLERLIKWDTDFPPNCWNGKAGLKELDRIIADASAALSAEPAQGEQLQQDVIDLVIAGRELVYSDEIRTGSELSTAFDKVLEVFSARIPWDDEPDNVAHDVDAAEQRNRMAFNLTAAIREMTEGEWEPDFCQSFELLDVLSAGRSTEGGEV